MSVFVCLDGAKVKHRIQSEDLKLWWCAEQAGIHRTTLRRWINGKIARVHWERANRLGAVLGVEVSQLQAI